MKQLNEFDTLEGEDGAREYEFNQERMISPDMMLALLSQYNSVLTLQEAAKTNDKAAGFLLALNGSVTAYNLMTSHLLGKAQQANLNQFVTAGIVTAEFRDAAIYYANVNPIKPYKDTTLLQFNQAKKIKTEKPASNWSAGKSITVTLNESLTEGSITVWSMESGFGYKNLGRPEHIQDGVNKYRIDLTNIKVVGDVYIRIPFEEVDYTVEVE